MRAKRSQTLHCAALARETLSDIMFHCFCARNAFRRFATLADALARPPRSARSSTMPKPTPFQPGHTLEYAVEVVSRDAKGSATCWCLFCVHEGCDEVEIGQNGHKRKRTTQINVHRTVLPTQVPQPSQIPTRRVMGALPGPVENQQEAVLLELDQAG